MTYRIYLPILARAFRGKRRVAVTIEAGATVAVIGPAEDAEFVVAKVDGDQFHISIRDLAERGTRVDAAAGS